MRKILREIFLIPIYLYRGLLSPFFGPSCRYTPSCSSYFIQAVKKHGIIKGAILGFARLFRCRKSFLGGPDPVPETFSLKEIRDRHKIYKKPKGFDKD
ncbi:MAG TPA: membrane protein insertion efficiency factor YidD [Candidatus Ornithospirochaeta avicola]|uniref:Putative membrane protein insertion efficiency factor n=1 Tax=Candidatus Ornithospirochaeta avicola TaxID=2840896 RepID=A0A9D1PUR4_9SPIO|nr:membrane protein insertion efficiency factor YidD [Candidatus Ornithospirochaeta avicola]